MRRFWLACTMVIVVGISSCVDSDKDLYQEAPGAEINTSNFSTIRKVQVEIDYSNSESRVPFSIYDGNPLIEGENTTILKENVQALDGAWTDEQGKFTATVELPAYVSNVYIVSTSPFARQAIPGKIVNGVLKVSDTDEQLTTRASYRESTRFDRNRFNNLGWNTNLGSFDDRSGVIDYVYKGNDPKLTLSKSEMNELRTTVSKVLNTLGSCPEEYRTQADLYVEEDETAVVLTALRGWTCWNSSLGYYYYRYDQAPASLKDVKVYAVFPNTQMTWNNGSLQASPQGIKEGTAVQLKYFDDPEYPKGKNFHRGTVVKPGLLEAIQQDLQEAGIKVDLSPDINRDTFIKWSFISAMAVTGAYYDVPMGEVQKPGKIRDTFIGLSTESAALGKKLGVEFPEDPVSYNLKVIDKLDPESTASMQKDLARGHDSEIQGLLFDMIAAAEEQGIDIPTYRMVAEKFKESNH